MTGRKFRTIKKALDTPTEIAGVIVLAAGITLGILEILDDWPTVAVILVGASMWGGARISRLSHEGVDFEHTDSEEE